MFHSVSLFSQAPLARTERLVIHVFPILLVFCMLPSFLPFIFVCFLFVGLFVCLFLFAVSLIDYLIVSFVCLCFLVSLLV